MEPLSGSFFDVRVLSGVVLAFRGRLVGLGADFNQQGTRSGPSCD